MNDTSPSTSDAASPEGLAIRPGPKLASGRDADVFDLGNGRVLRRNRDATKTSEPEAEIMRFVHERGYSVPAVYEASGPDLVMDRVDGPTMLADLGARPWMLWQHARTLAKLHRQLHGIPAPDWLPTYTSHPAFTVISGSVGAPSPSAENGAGPVIPDAILHLDLHPDNVILSRTGPVVIDWRNARRGDGAIDLATTWLILATAQVPDTGPQHRLVRLMRGQLVAAFLRHVDREAASRQLLTVAHYRLSDPNLLVSERQAILDLIRRSGVTV